MFIIQKNLNTWSKPSTMDDPASTSFASHATLTLVLTPPTSPCTSKTGEYVDSWPHSTSSDCPTCKQITFYLMLSDYLTVCAN